MKYIDAEKLEAALALHYAEITIPVITDERGVESYIRRKEIRAIQKIIDSLQQEQPEVDLEKEFAHEYAIYHLPTFILTSLVDGTELIDFIYKTARHFYDLGLKARKEKEE